MTADFRRETSTFFFCRLFLFHKIPDRIADRVKPRGVPVRDPAVEFVFERHDQLLDVERIEVPEKRRVVRELVFGDAPVICDDSPDPFGDG